MHLCRFQTILNRLKKVNLGRISSFLKPLSPVPFLNRCSCTGFHGIRNHHVAPPQLPIPKLLNLLRSGATLIFPFWYIRRSVLRPNVKPSAFIHGILFAHYFRNVTLLIFPSHSNIFPPLLHLNTSHWHLTFLSTFKDKIKKQIDNNPLLNL